MDQQKNNRKVSAILAAYNEAPRVGAVLDVLVKYPRFSEVIIIDDGSTDGTDKIIKKYDVKYIRNEKNIGKGFSMDLGVSMASEDVVFFCDADIRGLTNEVIDQIIDPVLEERVDMFIGMRNREVYMANILGPLVKIGPLLGGERALRKSLWGKLPEKYKHKFRIETGLNFYAEHYSRGFNHKIFPELTQIIKEEKYGFIRGTIKRIFMIRDILIAHLTISLTESPKIYKKTVNKVSDKITQKILMD